MTTAFLQSLALAFILYVLVLVMGQQILWVMVKQLMKFPLSYIQLVGVVGHDQLHNQFVQHHH
jgi:cell division septal protein FtsQ